MIGRNNYRKTKAGGGWKAIRYSLEKAIEVGPWKLWKKMRSANACKTCALGMGGLAGGMVNEQKHFPEVCKKSLQAQVADMKGSIPHDFFEKYDVETLLSYSPKQLEDAGRLSYPVILENNAKYFKPISFEKAIEYISLALTNTKADQTAFYSSGRSSNEAAFLLQSFARVYGTNNVMNCSYYCHQASSVALQMVLGSGTATIDINDLDKTDLVLLIGANPASNHPRLMTKLAQIRNRGGQVIVVNPIFEPALHKFHVPSNIKSLFFGSEIASLYVQPLAGGDIALLVGVLKAILELNKINWQFLKEYTTNWQSVINHASDINWQEIIDGSGVSQEIIYKMANMLLNSKAAIFAWAMGLTHHKNGVDNILALCNLALATGNVGKPGAGLLPIRGHSNVQGIGSVGFTPTLKAGVKQVLEMAYQKELPSINGLDTYAMIESADAGNIKTLIALGGNLWGSNPNSNWASSAMQKIKTSVYLSTKLNQGHIHGRGENTIILPVLARDEEKQSTTQESMFSYVRLSAGGDQNIKGQMQSETEIIAEIANKVLGKSPVNWLHLQNHDEIRKLISQSIPGYKNIADIDSTHQEFTVDGRVFHEPVFLTEDKHAYMEVTPLPVFDPNALRLITIRSEGQFNTVVYEEADIYRGIPHRYCLLISSQDANRFAIKDGQRIRVRGEAGSMDNIEIVVGSIRSGVVAMFYPEANILIKGDIDDRSKTPAFKNSPVWIETY
jgi:molybdopterin-dependent oxidoreductase alpha subunit